MEKSDVETPWRLRITQEEARVFQLFRTGEFGDPARGLFQSRTRLEKGAEDLKGWDILLSYQDGMPALAQKAAGKGRIWWWNLAVAPADSTWAGESAFLPFLGEVLLESRPAFQLPASHETAPGQPATWVPGRFLEGGLVTLVNSAGQETPVQEDLRTGGLRYISVNPLEPGLYHWTVQQENQSLGGHVVSTTAVNVPEEEMDLRTLEVEAVNFGETLATSPTAGLSLAELRDGVPLWPWFLAVAVAALILEGLVLAFVGRGVPPASAPPVVPSIPV
jgi:hypothetical protein